MRNLKTILLVLVFALMSVLKTNAQILSLESKDSVIVNVVSLRMDKVKMLIESESRNALAITVTGRYVESSTGDFIKAFDFSVPNELANQLGQIPIPNGLNLIETRNIQLQTGVFAIIGQYNDFGLSADKWEVITENNE